MRRIWRHCFVWLLAITLIVGGWPLAHAAPCPSGPALTTSIHHDVHMEVAVGAHHHDMEQADPAPASQPQQNHAGNTIADLCNCLNCNMCTTPGVAPSMRPLQPERRCFAVNYSLAVTGQRRAPVFVDPGIPIRTV